MFVNSFCDCGDCSTVFTYPVLPSDPDCTAGASKSEITLLLIVPNGATLPTDWTVKADWEAVLANDNTDNTKGKYLRGIGNQLAPETTTIAPVDAVDVAVFKKYTLTHKVRAITDTKYTFLKGLQCSPDNYKFWFYTKGEYLMGGAIGIQPIYTNVDFVYEEGKNSITEAILTIRYGTKGCDPDRALIAGLASGFNALATPEQIFGTGGDGFGTATEFFG